MEIILLIVLIVVLKWRKIMSKLLVVVDMQNDFITGSLANVEAQKIVPKIKKYIDTFDGRVVFTQDTHYEDYLDTEEGKKLPVEHCIVDTEGWEIVKELQYPDTIRFKKFTFGSIELGEFIHDYYQTTSKDDSSYLMMSHVLHLK
jgi:hypothetical protein